MASRKLTLMVSPCNEAGHLNACIGSMRPMLERGHRVVFIVHETWRGRPASYGFDEFVFSGEIDPKANSMDKMAEFLDIYQIIGPHSTMRKMENCIRFFESGNYEKKLAPLNEALKAASIKFGPIDAYVVDDHAVPPAVQYSGRPWIKNCSMQPMCEIFDDTLPPGGSGYATTGDRTEWPKFNEIRRHLFYSKQFNDFLETIGYDRYPNDTRFPDTQMLTVYACPEELSLPQIRAKGWFNLEAFNKIDASGKRVPLEESLPEPFFADQLDGKWSGKWIYISMGSMGSIDIELMRRIIAACAGTPHKFIVSKGPRHAEIELPRNMWGERYLPQTAILPNVDLVITHGGNNSVTETFAAGKPMIVLPLFADQFDNAQRLHETGLGRRVDAYAFKPEELRDTIEQILSDRELAAKLAAASARLQANDAHRALAIKIEQLLQSQ